MIATNNHAYFFASRLNEFSYFLNIFRTKSYLCSFLPNKPIIFSFNLHWDRVLCYFPPALDSFLVVLLFILSKELESVDKDRLFFSSFHLLKL